MKIMADDRLAEILTKIRRAHALREEHPYLADIISILLPHKDGLHREKVFGRLERQRQQDGLPIPSNFAATTQGIYNSNCLGYSGFRKRNLPESDALFYSPDRVGSGIWAVNRERAKIWLERQSLTFGAE